MSSITFFLFLIPTLGAILLAVNFIFATHNPYSEKNSAFECGFHSFLGQNRMQFNISFYIFCLLFLLFDLEILLIYPYPVSSYFNSLYGLCIMLVFFLALTLGFVFELGKNALKIDSRQDSQKDVQIKSQKNILDITEEEISNLKNGPQNKILEAKLLHINTHRKNNIKNFFKLFWVRVSSVIITLFGLSAFPRFMIIEHFNSYILILPLIAGVAGILIFIIINIKISREEANNTYNYGRIFVRALIISLIILTVIIPFIIKPLLLYIIEERFIEIYLSKIITVSGLIGEGLNSFFSNSYQTLGIDTLETPSSVEKSFKIKCVEPKETSLILNKTGPNDTTGKELSYVNSSIGNNSRGNNASVSTRGNNSGSNNTTNTSNNNSYSSNNPNQETQLIRRNSNRRLRSNDLRNIQPNVRRAQFNIVNRRDDIMTNRMNSSNQNSVLFNNIIQQNQPLERTNLLVGPVNPSNEVLNPNMRSLYLEGVNSFTLEQINNAVFQAASLTPQEINDSLVRVNSFTPEQINSAVAGANKLYKQMDYVAQTSDLILQMPYNCTQEQWLNFILYNYSLFHNINLGTLVINDGNIIKFLLGADLIKIKYFATNEGFRWELSKSEYFNGIIPYIWRGTAFIGPTRFEFRYYENAQVNSLQTNTGNEISENSQLVEQSNNLVASIVDPVDKFNNDRLYMFNRLFARYDGEDYGPGKAFDPNDNSTKLQNCLIERAIRIQNQNPGSDISLINPNDLRWNDPKLHNVEILLENLIVAPQNIASHLIFQKDFPFMFGCLNLDRNRYHFFHLIFNLKNASSITTRNCIPIDEVVIPHTHSNVLGLCTYDILLSNESFRFNGEEYSLIFKGGLIIENLNYLSETSSYLNKIIKLLHRTKNDNFVFDVLDEAQEQNIIMLRYFFEVLDIPGRHLGGEDLDNFITSLENLRLSYEIAYRKALQNLWDQSKNDCFTDFRRTGHSGSVNLLRLLREGYYKNTSIIDGSDNTFNHP